MKMYDLKIVFKTDHQAELFVLDDYQKFRIKLLWFFFCSWKNIFLEDDEFENNKFCFYVVILNFKFQLLKKNYFKFYAGSHLKRIC